MKLRIYNKTLDPKIWDENKTLNPEVKESLLKIAEDFYNSTDLKSEIHNILFLGSSANYNWTDSSDIDLHVVIDIAEEKINEEYARKFMDGLAAKWNTDHEITVKQHPVEVYLQDVREPNATAELARPGAAIYSIFDDKWVVEPNPQNIKIDADKIRKKYHELKDRITNLIQSEDIEKLKALMVSIRNYRNAGMSEGGEFSVENIVFKALRHSGSLEKLKTAVNTIYDKKASLPEEGNRPSYKKTQPLNEILSNGKVVLGNIDDYLDINNVKVGGDDNHSGRGHRWRYKHPFPAVFWWESDPPPTQQQKDAVSDFLKNKYNVDIISHRVGQSSISNTGFSQIHRDDPEFNPNDYELMNEVISDKPFLIVGFINGDLEVNSEIDYEGATKHYYDTPVVHRNHFGIAWRYKSKTNTVYFHETSSIEEKEKDAILDHLHTKYNVVNPNFDFTGWGVNYNKAHFINELSTIENEINRDDWKEVITDMKAWLILESKLGDDPLEYLKDTSETLVATLRGIEKYYEGGITGFLRDYDSGKLKENRINEVLSGGSKDVTLQKIGNEYTHYFKVGEKEFNITFKKVVHINDLEDCWFDEHELEEYQRDDVNMWIMENNIWGMALYQLRQPGPEITNYYPHFKSRLSQITGDIKAQSIYVYSEVLSAIRSFEKRVKPHIFIFIPAEDKQGKLYNLLVGRFLKGFGYKRMIEDPYFGKRLPPDTFVFIRDTKMLKENKGLRSVVLPIVNKPVFLNWLKNTSKYKLTDKQAYDAYMKQQKITWAPDYFPSGEPVMYAVELTNGKIFVVDGVIKDNQWLHRLLRDNSIDVDKDVNINGVVDTKGMFHRAESPLILYGRYYKESNISQEHDQSEYMRDDALENLSNLAKSGQPIPAALVSMAGVRLKPEDYDLKGGFYIRKK